MATDDTAVKGCGCAILVVLVIGVIVGIVSLVDRCTREDIDAKIEKSIEETEFTDEMIELQDKLFRQCLNGERALGRLPASEVAQLWSLVRDRSDIELWKTRRLALFTMCIDAGYYVEP